MRLYDAHNHLHDERLTPWREQFLPQLREAGVARMVVNGSCESDWADVLCLARREPIVLPSFGYHPWHVRERTPDWQQRLVQLLDQVPSAIGEIGLDRWILDQWKADESRVEGTSAPGPPANLEEQADVFTWQLGLAAERNLPVSIHCLQAWGLLHDILRRETRPACGFLLHSYGGPAEMVKPLADLGAYFSLPGYFAHERKQRQREAFRRVPPERLLIETDAPDQCLPETRDCFPLTDPGDGRRLNHPANIGAVYEFAADLLGETIESLAERVEANFLRLFQQQPRPPH
ncbi:MAG: TatD family hydrolase [Verrucomicrobia bacterium]|jgi:TatD DNase family protein|nr:TatD family hydrolase [Verrucomicrobiota bacterium]